MDCSLLGSSAHAKNTGVGCHMSALPGRNLDHWIPDGRDMRLLWLGGGDAGEGVGEEARGAWRGESMSTEKTKGALKVDRLQEQM